MMRILLAEDNPVNQMITKRIVEKLGTVVDIAQNGMIAVEMAQIQKYDLIFMDINMPVMSGKDAVRELRELGFTMPIVALTAQVDELASEVNPKGFTELVPKPVSLAQIEMVVNKYRTSVNEKIDDTMQECIDYVYEQLGLEADIVVELVGEFIPDSNLHLNLLREAVQVKDIASMTSEAHYIKGAAKNIGLVNIGLAAELIEKNARDNNDIDYVTATDTLELKIKNFTKNYQEYLSSSN
jgi:two-component system aerobic respiration control sensor histidine kinase ArcB